MFFCGLALLNDIYLSIYLYQFRPIYVLFPHFVFLYFSLFLMFSHLLFLCLSLPLFLPFSLFLSLPLLRYEITFCKHCCSLLIEFTIRFQIDRQCLFKSDIQMTCIMTCYIVSIRTPIMTCSKVHIG